MTRFRILHAISQIPDITGSGVYVSAMIRHARARGHDNFLVAGVPGSWQAPNPSFSDENSAFVRFDGPDLDFPVVGMSDAMPYPSRRFKDLGPDDLSAYEKAFGRKLADSARRFSPDLVHCHHLWVLAATARRTFPRLPVTATCHGSDLRQAAACPAIRENVAPFLRDLDAVMALSEAQKKEISAIFGIDAEKIVVIGAGYDAGRFVRGAKPEAPPVEILYAGKISRAKGLGHLMAGLDRLDPALDFRLRLAGGGQGREKEELFAMARALGPAVSFLGPLAQKKLAEKMAQSHIFILPSLFEGLPLVLLEAAASGCRIVSTTLPGAVEVFGGRDIASVSFAALPAMEKVDKVPPEAAASFEAGLAAALDAQIRMVLRGDQADHEKMDRLLADFRWPAVFRRAEAVYGKITVAA